LTWNVVQFNHVGNSFESYRPDTSSREKTCCLCSK